MTISKNQLSEMKNVKLTDTDEANKVSLYCSNEYVSQMDILINCRGLVFVDEKPFFQGFPFAIELNDETVYTENLDIEKCRIYQSHEGTLIRVFNINGKWYTSTNRKLNAFKSRWAAKKETFGTCFAAAIRQFFKDDEEDDEIYLNNFYTTTLNPENKYMFILKPSEEERIVCLSDPKIIHVGTFDINNNLLPGELLEGIESPKELNFMNIDELVSDLLTNVNVKIHQGFIAIHDDGRHFKIFHPKYQELFQVRGNVPSLRFRYLMLRKNESQRMFFELYPEMRQIASDIETQIFDLCVDLHKKYLEINIQGIDQFELSQEEEQILRIIHNQYLKTRIKTTPTRINDIITYGTAPRINRLLKLFTKR